MRAVDHSRSLGFLDGPVSAAHFLPRCRAVKVAPFAIAENDAIVEGLSQCRRLLHMPANGSVSVLSAMSHALATEATRARIASLASR